MMKKQILPNAGDIACKGYTRVTEVLLPYKSFDNILPEVLEHAAKRGDKVHLACELYALNMLIEDVEEEVMPFFQSFKKWFDDYVTNVFTCETRIWGDEILLTGQFDLLCKIKGSDDLVLVDYKTPAIHDISWRLQTAAYTMLLRRYCGINVSRRITLRLSKEGKSPIISEYLDHEHDERLYLNQLEIYRCFNPIIR